jgi:hypothetical protein
MINLIVAPRFVKLISFGTAGAITLYPIGIFFRSEKYLYYDDFIIHESIHWQQQKELWCIPFYLMYLYFWITRLGYRNIPFEKEAYSNQNNEDYLENRKKHAWRDYV